MSGSSDTEKSYSEFLRSVVQGNKNSITFAKDMTKDPSETCVVFEKKVVSPLRRESMARQHIFHDAEAMGDYLGQYGTDHTVILANIEARSIAAVLDETVSEGREVLLCRPVLHPLFAPWHGAITGPDMEPEACALFIMQHRRTIQQPDGKHVALVFSQIRVSKNVTLRKGLGPKAINAVMCELDIAGEVKAEPVAIPDTLTVQCPLVITGAPRTFEIDLFVYEKADNVLVRMTSPDIEERMLAEFEAMVTTIKKDCPEAVHGCGQILYTEWEYWKAGQNDR